WKLLEGERDERFFPADISDKVASSYRSRAQGDNAHRSAFPSPPAVRLTTSWAAKSSQLRRAVTVGYPVRSAMVDVFNCSSTDRSSSNTLRRIDGIESSATLTTTRHASVSVTPILNIPR